jgi:hypothetical protein
VIVYAVHLELLGLSQYAHWVYVLRHPELVQSPIDARTRRTATIRILVGPAAWAGAMLLALVSPRLGYAVFYVVLIGYVVAAVRDRTVVR